MIKESQNNQERECLFFSGRYPRIDSPGNLKRKVIFMLNQFCICVYGRWALGDFVNPETGEIVVKRYRKCLICGQMEKEAVSTYIQQKAGR